MQSGTVTADGGLPLFEATPEGSASRGLVVIHPAEGVNSYVEDVAVQLAIRGNHVVAPHLFHRTGDPVIASGDRETSSAQTAALRHDQIMDDLHVAFGYLRACGFPLPDCSILGFCMGGSVALLAAAQYQLHAAVTFYGGGVSQGRWGAPPLAEVVSGIRTPWLGLYGEEDKNIPLADVKRLISATKGVAIPHQIITFPGAGHGFHCPLRQDSFRPVAADAAWRQALSWLDAKNDVPAER